MKAISALAFILSAFQSNFVQATISWESRADQSRDLAVARAAFVEAINMANKVVADLGQNNPFSDLRVKAAFEPLFQESDLGRVLEIFRAIPLVESSSDIHVTFFLNEDHMIWDPKYVGGGSWVDTAFVNPDGTKLADGIPMDGGTATRTLGFDRSYTFQGYDGRIDGGIDLSNQKHTYLYSKIFQEETGYDKRSLDVIKQSGFLTDPTWYSSVLGHIDPVSIEILHELVHSVAGRYPIIVNPDDPTDFEVGEPVIGDGLGDEDINGWVACERISRSTEDGERPTQVAESYAMLGAALYLDTVGGHTCYWSTGWVDPNTGGAIRSHQAPRRKRDMMFTKSNETSYMEHHHAESDHADHGKSGMVGRPGPFKGMNGPDKIFGKIRSLAGRIAVPI